MNIKHMWQMKQSEDKPNTLDMFIYGNVESDSYDWWTDEIIKSETSANHFREELAKYSDVSNINIYVNSCGGSVFEGTAIYNQLKRHSAYKTVYVDGFACSIASVIAMAGDKVIMPRNTMMMIHNAWTYTSGNATQLRKAADDLETLYAGNRQAYLQKANGKIDDKQLAKMMDAETWLTAEDCIKYGFADEYAEADADLTEANAMLEKAKQSLSCNIAMYQSMTRQLTDLIKPIEQKKKAEEKTNILTAFFGI